MTGASSEPVIIQHMAQDTALVNEHVGLINQLYSIPQRSIGEGTLLP
jgi:hypothetical protein